eukprot:1179734-Prorocentrum_minimum.AAC.4
MFTRILTYVSAYAHFGGAFVPPRVHQWSTPGKAVTTCASQNNRNGRHVKGERTREADWTAGRYLLLTFFLPPRSSQQVPARRSLVVRAEAEKEKEATPAFDADDIIKTLQEKVRPLSSTIESKAKCS